MHSYMPKVSVIIIAYNSRHIIDILLQSLLQQSYHNIEILFVDNNSSDDSSGYVMQKYSFVKVIRSPKNLGYAGGANLGINHAQGELVFIVNDDIELDPNTIKELVLFLEKDPLIAAIQPKVRSYFERQKFEYAGAAGGLLDIIGYPFCRGRIFYTVEDDLGQYEKPARIFWASGAAFMGRKSAIQRIGLFDELFEFYHEETDLCWRLNLAGYKVAYVPSALVFHRGSHTSKKYFPYKQLINMHRNNLYMLIKNFSVRDLLLILPLRLLFEAINILYLLKRGERMHAMAILKSFIEVLFNMKKLLQKRLMNRKLINSPSDTWKRLIYPIPIIIEYFLLNRLKYFQLSKVYKGIYATELLQ